MSECNGNVVFHAFVDRAYLISESDICLVISLAHWSLSNPPGSSPDSDVHYEEACGSHHLPVPRGW